MEALFERERELEWLLRLVGAAASGSGRVVLLEGDAGIGKTGLLRAAREPAADHGVRVLVARGAELEGELAFGVVRELLGRAAAGRALDGAAALAAPVLTPTAGPVHQDLFATLHGLHWLVADLAAERPLLLVVDDAHWSDGPSLRFLAYLAHRLDGLAVSLLIATRPVAEAVPADLLGVLAGHPACHVLHLAPLGEAAVRTLVDDRLGAPDADFVDACLDATGGNPFLLGELLAELVMSGTPPRSSASGRIARVVPHEVERTVRRRLDRLGPDATALARAAAVLGDGTDPRRAVELSGIDAERAVHASDVLVAARLTERAAHMTFVHPLVRSAVAATVGPSELSVLHRRAAELLAADGEPAELLVPHLLAARPCADPWVVSVLRAAAGRAAGGGAADIAAGYLRRALAEPPPEADRHAVLTELGEAELWCGAPGALDTLRAAVERSGDVVERARAARLLVRLQFGRGEIAEAVRIGGAAIDALDGTEPGLAAEMEAELVVTAVQDSGAVAAARRRLARYAGDIAATGPEVRMLRAAAALEELVATRSRDRALTLVEQSLTGGDLIEDRTLATLPGALITLATCGSPGRAVRLWDEVLERRRGRGNLPGVALATVFRGHAHHIAGDVAAAVADLTGGRDLALAGDDHVMPGYVGGWLGSALVDADELEAADAEISAAAPLLSTTLFSACYLLMARGRLRLAQGRPVEAILDLRDCGRRLASWGSADPAPCGWRADLTRALAAAGDAGGARSAADDAVRSARSWAAPHAVSDALCAAGSVAAAGPRGLDLLAEAVDAADGFPLHRARALVELGAARRRAGERTAARGPLREGLDLALAAGAVAVARRAREELVVTGARPRRLRTTGYESLTPTERRVASIAAGGSTNREVAQALFVSEKTVETHLGHAYRKLGITARSQLSDALTPLSPRPDHRPAAGSARAGRSRDGTAR